MGFCLGGGGGCIQSGRGSSSRGVHPEREGVFLQGGVSRAGGGFPPGGVGQTPPHQVLRDTVNKRAVRIPLECILVVNLIQYT